jgi:hypothetical protein
MVSSVAGPTETASADFMFGLKLWTVDTDLALGLVSGWEPSGKVQGFSKERQTPPPISQRRENLFL